MWLGGFTQVGEFRPRGTEDGETGALAGDFVYGQPTITFQGALRWVTPSVNISEGRAGW